MGSKSKLLALYFSGFIVSVSFTIIGPFYPGIVKEKGMPLWAIGAIFSLVPLVYCFMSAVVTRYLETIGRRRAIVTALLLEGCGLILLAPIVHVSYGWLIVCSISSRLLSGVAAALGYSPSYAVLTSEFPNNVQQVVTGLQAVGGLGLILGPLLGSVLFIDGDVLYSFAVVGFLVCGYAPVFYCLLGPDRPYIKKIEHFAYTEFIRLKVSPNQRIFLVAVIQVLGMFQVAFLSAMIEIHLLDLGYSEKSAGYLYALLTGSFFCATLVITVMPQSADKRLVMSCGLLLYWVSFLLIGPWDVLFEGRGYVVVSLFLMGFSNGLATSKHYLVPPLPQMISSASNDYAYAEDDRLNDALSGIMAISNGVGEIVGPIGGGFLLDWFEFQDVSACFGFIFLFYGLYYLFGSGAVSDWFTRKNQSSDLEMTLT